MRTCLTLFVALAACLSFSPLAAQVPGLLDYQGRILVGSTNFNGNGQFKFALVNGNGSATYWSNDGTSTAGSEPASAVAITVTKGLYAVQLGDTAMAGMTTLPASVFANADVRLRIWFNDGATGFQQLAPDKRIAAVGYALMAEAVLDASITTAKLAGGAVTGDKIAAGAVDSTHLAAGLTLGGTTSGTFSGGLTGNVAGNATNFTGNLAGDVTGTQAATVVGMVGTSSAANVHAAEVAANAATPVNTANTLVKRDSSGNFAAGTMTGNITGSAASFTGSLAGDVTGTQGATSIAAGTVTGKALTGYASSTGTVSAADTILSALGKINGNDALKAPLASPTFTGTVSGSFSGPLTGNVTGNVSGSATGFTGALAGDVTGTQGATNISASTITVKALTGYAPSTGTVTPTDSILSAIGKLSGNDALKAPLASPTFTGTVSGSFSGPLTGNVTGSATSFTGSLAGDVTGTQGATSIAAGTVTGKTLTGYTSSAGTVSAADTILSAIGKLNGNSALAAPMASPTFTGTVTLPAGMATSAPLLLNSGVNLTTPAFGALEFDGTNLYITNNSGTPTRKTVAYTDTPVQIGTWIFADVQPSGTFGGTATGGVWSQRVLNSVRFTSGAACTLASNRFTLQPGTYTIRASAPAAETSRNKIRLYNVTDAIVAAYGSSEMAGIYPTRSHLTARIQVTSAKAFQIEHYNLNTMNNSGFGYPTNASGAEEIYTIVEITQ